MHVPFTAPYADDTNINISYNISFRQKTAYVRRDTQSSIHKIDLFARYIYLA